MEKRVIDITSVTNRCVTRSKGRQAALRLSSYIDDARICRLEIDLRNAELVSLSYLDELVCHYLDSVNKGNVVFISNRDIDRRLSRIAAVRSVTIHCRNSQNRRYVVPSACHSAPTPVFAASKR